MQRIQYRQLIDLLGTLPSDARGEQLDAAYDQLGQLAATIPGRPASGNDPRCRTALARTPVGGSFGGWEPAVASAALQSARLGSDEWLDLVPALRHRHAPRCVNDRICRPKLPSLLTRLGINDRGLPPAPTG